MRSIKCKEIDKDWSVITLGCWQIAPSEGWGNVCSPRDAEAVVKAALDVGITAFDTAEGYGDGESERRLGKALGNKKDDVIIISKIWPDAELDISSYKKRLEGSLHALDRDYVDVYLVHWPGEYFNTYEKSASLCKLMAALKESGKAKVVGLSNFHEEDLMRLGGGISLFSVNQVPYSLLRREYEGETRTLCKKEGIPYMAYSPTAQGLLAGRLDEAAHQFRARKKNQHYQQPLYSHALKVLEGVRKIAQECGKKPIEVVLAWVLAQDNILTAIVGSRKIEQITDYVGATALELSEVQLKELTGVSDIFLQQEHQL